MVQNHKIKLRIKKLLLDIWAVNEWKAQVHLIKIDLNNFVDDILPGALLLYNSPKNEIIENAVQTLICLSQNLDQKQQVHSLNTLRTALSSLEVQADTNLIPGMSHPKVFNFFIFFQILVHVHFFSLFVFVTVKVHCRLWYLYCLLCVRFFYLELLKWKRSPVMFWEILLKWAHQIPWSLMSSILLVH